VLREGCAIVERIGAFGLCPEGMAHVADIQPCSDVSVAIQRQYALQPDIGHAGKGNIGFDSLRDLSGIDAELWMHPHPQRHFVDELCR
jgi:hypothetical protein